MEFSSADKIIVPILPDPLPNLFRRARQASKAYELVPLDRLLARTHETMNPVCSVEFEGWESKLAFGIWLLFCYKRSTMARPLRNIVPPRLLSRHLPRQQPPVIYRDHDRSRFVERLTAAIEIFSVRLHAYVLMSNPFDLIFSLATLLQLRNELLDRDTRTPDQRAQGSAVKLFMIRLRRDVVRWRDTESYGFPFVGKKESRISQMLLPPHGPR
jgi:hypothetical protein